MIDNFWTETDNAILQCLRERGAMSPADLAHELGISPGESAALVCLLAAEGKVKVRLVEVDEEAADLEKESGREAAGISLPSRPRRERVRPPARALEPVPVSKH